MKIDSNLIKRISRDIFKQSKDQVIDRRIMHPNRDWFAGLLVGTLLVAGGSYSSINVFKDYQTIDNTPGGAPNTALIYREVEVERALQYLKDRSQRHETSLNTTQEITPPPDTTPVSPEEAESPTTPTVEESAPPVEVASPNNPEPVDNPLAPEPAIEFN